MKRILASILVVGILISCDMKVNNPQSAEYPCGPLGVECGGGMCCWQGDECNVPTCPAGYCCYVGDDNDTRLMSDRPGVFRHRPYPQLKR